MVRYSKDNPAPVIAFKDPLGNTLLTWCTEPDRGISYFEHNLTLPMVISDAHCELTKKWGIGHRGIVRCGRSAMNLLERLPPYYRFGVELDLNLPQWDVMLGDFETVLHVKAKEAERV